jgi:dihydroorotate dehydrogenase (NAD+) catalytic subunit
MAIDPWTARPVLGADTGGLSGPALKPVALAAVWTCATSCGLPIVGVGGVLSGRDARDLLDAGASAVQVGTALFRDPGAAARVNDELARAARGGD